MERPSPEVQEQLVEAIGDLELAVVVLDGARIVYANEAAGKTSNTTAADLMAKGSFFEFVAPEERERLGERLRKRLAGGLAPYEEIDVKLRDGRRIHLEMAVKLLSGAPGRLVVLYRDVTARKAEEARLRQIEKLAAVGKLLAGVAHDINTPLAVILSNMDVTREELARVKASGDSISPEQVDALIARLEANRAHVRRIATSIRRLQGLGSPQAPRRVPTDVRPLLLALLTVARFGAHGRCEIHADLPELAPVACDGEVVAHAVQNLVSNAVDVAKADVTLKARTENGSLEIVVEDDGPGLPPEAMERVFEPFFTTKPAGSMGLGLTLARGIATDHGGTLTAENRPEGGARLTLRIPLGAA